MVKANRLAMKPAAPTEPIRKVPLLEVEQRLQLIEALLDQLEKMAVLSVDELDGMDADVVEQLVLQKQQSIAAELAQMGQEARLQAEQIINRMLNQVGYETRNRLGYEAVAQSYRAQAAVIGKEAARSKARIARIKQVILAFLVLRNESRLKTAQHKLHLSTRWEVRIDQEQVPGLERLIQLNQKYPGLLRQLKFSAETGTLINVEFSSKTIQRILKMDDDEAHDDLSFASFDQVKHLIIPTIEESQMKQQVHVIETQYGPELIEG